MIDKIVSERLVMIRILRREMIDGPSGRNTIIGRYRETGEEF
jgi:hypothetical protein